jgi:site-specific DNA recombinase
MKAGTPAATRCAVYTRTAVLGACARPTTHATQRAACVRYIRQQAGWILIPHRYEDRGKSGANLDRPALQRLLADVDAHRVDVVVVHQSDRLSRWFADFVAIMDRFGRADVSWVSVTEGISTADVCGQRLLGLVMSFAELERAVHGVPPPELERSPGWVR